VKLPNLGYHLARAEGRILRAAYAAALRTNIRPGVTTAKTVAFDVCSYSGRSMLPEQVASIRSFLHHAGRPHAFVVFSDGTHSSQEIELLHRIDDCVGVRAVPVTGITDQSVQSYLSSHHTGRQLSLMMSLRVERPTLYVDADVLFFPGAEKIQQLLSHDSAAPALFLRDCQLAADERVFRTDDERSNPVNTGMILFRDELNWSLALERLRELNGEPAFHTNQTLTHLVMHANGAAALDPTKFVLQLDDQFIYRDLHARPEIVARHYVNPVRHKFWTALLR
jgi:hypothetical protein